MKKNIRMKSAAIAALFSLVALLGCNNAAGSSSNGSVTGQVFGYITDTKGEPVEGATVALGNMTTTTNTNGAFALTGVPANATQNAATSVNAATGTTQTYTLTVTKDGYLSNKVDGITVVETTDKSDAALLLNTAATAYATILNTFAGVGGTGATAIAAGTTIAADGLILDTQNTNDTFKGMADAYATILDRYANLSKTYESTFVTTTLTPCNAYVEGSLKITKSPQKNITTDAASIKAAPADVKVKLVSAAATGATTGYVYETTTDKDGKFKFEGLPVNTALTFKVEGFEAPYESGEGENKVVETYYYSLTDGAGATANLYDGEELQENVLTFTLEENSGAKYKADILLYSQPAKIIVTNTNLLQNTEVAPLALNTPVTVTFNKPMDYVKLVSETGVTTVDELGEKAAYAWDDKKTTVTITPKDGYWTSSSDTVTFKLDGLAQDGATTFIDNKFTVKLDNVIKVVFADTSSAAADSFTLTFDRELVKTDVVKVTDDKSESLTLTWDKTNAAAPVLTVKARDGKFATTGDHTFTITGVEAKDQSTVLYSYNREFAIVTSGTTSNFTFKTRFDGFKATGIEVVDKAEGDLSRAVVATTAQYLKITFNKNIGDVKNLTVSDVVPSGTTGTANTAKYKYVKDNAVYVSLANFEDDRVITISGSVTSTSGDVFTGAAGSEVTWTDLIAGYKVRTAYVIAASNLYVENASINAGNDKTVNTIKKGDNVTLTFNKDIPSDAVITTELYVYADNKLVNMEETGYKATPSISGKVVTLTLNETKPGTTYYLSLKIKSKDGAELFSTGSKSFGTGNSVKDLYIEPSIKYTFPATQSGATAKAWDGKTYIKIEVAAVKLLPEGSSKTTKVADFKKTSNGNIVLQFNQDVTGYTAYLYDGTQDTRDILAANPTDLTKPANFVNLGNNEKKYFYGATATVSGDTITIVPAGSFASDATPGIVVYDDEGNWVELGTATTKTVGGTTVNTYTPYAPYKAKHYTAKLNPDEATTLTGFTIATTKESGYTAGEYPKFSLKMFAANKYTDDLPTLTLYKKVKNGYGDDEWVAVGIQTIYKEEALTNAYNQYSFFKVDNATAYFTSTAGAEITYGSEDLVVLTTVDNMIFKSNVVTITK